MNKWKRLYIESLSGDDKDQFMWNNKSEEEKEEERLLLKKRNNVFSKAFDFSSFNKINNE